MFLIGFIFTPCTVYFQPFLHFFPTVPHVVPSPLSHRLWTSYPILDWFLSRSAARLAVILGFPSGWLGVPDSWIPRLSLLWVSFIFLHNYTNTPPIVFPCTSTASNFLKSLVRVKAAVNVGWGVGVVGLSPASPWPPSHLAPALGLRPADRSSLL